MDREPSPMGVLLSLVAALAILVALSVGGMMVMSRSMMGGGGMGWGWWDLGLLVVAAVVAVAALALLFRTRAVAVAPAMPAISPRPLGEAVAAPAPAVGEPAEDLAQLERFQEAAVVKTLGEDERLLYIRVREAGGAALQRDLVAQGGFSKAKVTRLLDKLERKGLVVRERYGATNRVRLTWKEPGAR